MVEDIFIHNKNDSVGVVLSEGTEIPMFHKVALSDIEKDADVYEYGEVIGHATEHISKGEHVHTHNLATNRW